MKLLHIIASPRLEKSRTLQISNEFLKSEKAKHPGLVVDTLDLFKVDLPKVTGEITDAKYVLMSGGSLNEQAQYDWEKVMKYSTDFLSYDYYLISSPMWNFTVPYKLKHYIDIIMQAGVLFKFTPEGVEGLAKNKKMFCITTRGSDYSSGNYMHQFDFQEPYLRSIFGLAGITDISFINAQPMDYAPEVTKMNLMKAMEDARSMALNGEAVL